MTTHYLKTWPEFFRFVADGSKPFDVRENDRGYAEGDTLVLLEWEPAAVVEDDRDGYSGRWVERRVSYVLQGGAFGLAHGHVVMGLGSPLMDLRDTLATVADCDGNCSDCRELARLALEGARPDDDTATAVAAVRTAGLLGDDDRECEWCGLELGAYVEMVDEDGATMRLCIRCANQAEVDADGR